MADEKAAKTIGTRVKRTITVRHLKPPRSQEAIDKRVIAELKDDAAWEEAVEVRRQPK
jgi:hypothetical protein